MLWQAIAVSLSAIFFARLIYVLTGRAYNTPLTAYPSEAADTISRHTPRAPRSLSHQNVL